MSFSVFGQHRSGTSYFLDLVRHHPKVDTVNEPISMHILALRDDNSNFVTLSEPLENATPEILGYLGDLERWLNEGDGRIRGIKETAYFSKFEWLQETLRFDKTIVLVRDPRSFVSSILRRNLHDSWWDYRTHVARLGFNCDDMPDYAVCVELWKHRLNILELIASKPEAILVRLEDVVSKPETLSVVMNHIGLSLHEEQTEFLSETSRETRDSTYSNFRQKEDVINGWEKRLDQSTIDYIQEHLQNELRRFGYH